MPRYRYKAAALSGEIREGELQAAHQQEAVNHLQSQGLTPIRVEEGRGPIESESRGSWNIPLGRHRQSVDQGALRQITVGLTRLLRSGIPLERALTILLETMDAAPSRELLQALLLEVREGASLAEALEQREAIFPAFYTGMVRAGEEGGDLARALGQVAEYQERIRKLRESVIASLIYPTILLVVAVLSLILLLAYVVPQFQELFQSAGQSLPLVTRVVMAVGTGIQSYGWAGLLGLLGLLIALRQAMRTNGGRYRIDRFLIRMPGIGPLVVNGETARLARTLSLLLTNGVPLLRALRIAQDSVGNRVLRQGLAQASERVRSGASLSAALQEIAVLPPLAVQMARVGEESGHLASMLGQVADSLDEETQEGINRALALLEPALILGLGVLVGGVILSILVAILGMNQLAV